MRSKRKSPRIMVIGLDAATLDLVEPWARAGHLPAISRLMSEGSSSTLLSTPNMHSASAWTSILTGLNPGRHGLFVFSDRDFETGRQSFFKGGDRTGDLIISHLAHHGLTAGLLNVPMTYPAECAAGGFCVSGLDAPSLNESAFAPKELREELLGRFPDYSFTPSGLGELMSSGRVDEAAQKWIAVTETQTEAASYLLESHPVDFFMTVFTASDWGGHNLWYDVDRESPLLQIYRTLDSAIERLLQFTSSETQVYVISDHGMGRHTGASYHLAAWLEENGLMVRSNGVDAKSSLVGAGRRAARALLPLSLREKIRASVGEERMSRIQGVEKDAFYSSIDWSNTVAYTEPGRHVININLAGRNANGIVPASDYDSVCETISRCLSDWVDPNGRHAVAKVVRRDEAYEGPFRERASDLFVNWNPEANFGDPPEEVKSRGFWWKGDHRPEGILIARGPGVRVAGQLELPTLYDLVPTLMYLAGLPMPEGLDGRVIQELADDEFRLDHPIRSSQPEDRDQTSSADFTNSEEQQVEEKLRSLGYL